MRAYLSSYQIPTPKDLLHLVGKPANSTRTAIIPNAKDYYAPRARSIKIGEKSEYLASIGLQSETVDLLAFTDSGLLKTKLQTFDCLWVVGGNTFCLRYAMHYSGFDKIIKNLLSDGLVYIGESAGACVAGTTLKGVETADNPDYSEQIIWDGLGLLPNILLPHADNPAFADDVDYVRELYKNDASLLELNDDQALIVNGETQRITN